ncbi:MAG TPA: peptide chain release factor N(5)-glutamine methyltransferase, partial [Ktedonobacterales bacterium]
MRSTADECESRPTTWGEALTVATHMLARAGVSSSAQLDAVVLLGHVVGARRAALLAYPERALTHEQWMAYLSLVRRRMDAEPVAYLTGHREFMALDFLTDRRALIPRPETEQLVEAALDAACARIERDERPIVADIGTGTGAIAIALTVHEPRLVRIYATDISTDALALADENVRRHHVEDRVLLLHGDLADPLPEPVDLLVANLPYVSSDQADTLARDVRAYEPGLALYGEAGGLGHIARLLRGAPARLRPGAEMFLEI